MSRVFIQFCCHYVGLSTVCLALVLAPVAIGHTQSRSAASQVNSTAINDQINLQVLQSIVVEMTNSFKRNCTKPDGTTVTQNQTWQTTTCPGGLASGNITYICQSGFNVLQSSTCH